jgi:hypothetical protein
MTQELRERKLRQQIHALRVKKLGWPVEGFKFIISGLGFGDSLKALPEAKLVELKSLMINYRKHGRPQIFTYDKQGRYMFALMKQAHWTESDVRSFMIKHFRKSHWNLLSKSERRAVIAMLQSYIKKQSKTENNTNSNINSESKEDSHDQG